MRKKLGFTLVELLISISIIALLTVTLSISFSRAQKNGRDSKRQSDMKVVQSAAEQYYLLNSSSYPDDITMPWNGSGGQLILQSFPVDPKSGSGWSYNVVSMSSSSYCICAGMENNKGNASGSNCSDLSKTNGAFFCVMNQQ